MARTSGRDCVGKIINGFKVLDYKRENERTYLQIVCPKCGNTRWMRIDQVKIGSSCGCVRDESRFSPNDLTNKKFGRLKAVKMTPLRDINGSVIWECACDCGNTAYVSSHNLKTGRTKSCGCHGAENSKCNGKIAGKNIKDNFCVGGTNINNLSMKISKRNKSGVKGVSWDKRRNKWLAQIGFKGKNYYLGRYDTKEKAAEIREIAEEKIFGEFLKWYEEVFLKQDSSG